MGWDAITEARASLSAAADAHKLLLEDKGTLNQEKGRVLALDVSERLLRAQEAVFSAARERSAMLDEIESLSSALHQKIKVLKHLDAYYLADTDGVVFGDPYCLLCWERRQLLIHIIRKSSVSNCCPNCDREYLKETTKFDMPEREEP